MQQVSKQPAFELGQIVATPGALAALKKAGQTARRAPPSVMFTREWPIRPMETAMKRLELRR